MCLAGKFRDEIRNVHHQFLLKRIMRRVIPALGMAAKIAFQSVHRGHQSKAIRELRLVVWKLNGASIFWLLPGIGGTRET
jgi:hypothetical protein